MLLDYMKYAYKIAYALCEGCYIFLSSRPFCYASKALHGFMNIIYIYKHNRA